MLKFTKMHGAGNDYVYVDCFEQELPNDIPALASAMSDRHTGIGADGLILICPPEIAGVVEEEGVAGAGPQGSPGENSPALNPDSNSRSADARMRMWNADGSPGEMCGNGIRCLAKYLYERRQVQQDVMHIGTDAGLRRLELCVESGRVELVRVNMGEPILDADKIPTTLPGNPPLNVVLPIENSPITANEDLSVSAISMGNPHCVTFVDAISDQLVHGLGPLIETHPAFPNRVNAEFVQVISPTEINMRVWERGSGETQACGSGACAALVAAVLNDHTENKVTCHLPGGDLQLEWGDSKDVYMTGPAVEVFDGEWSMKVDGRYGRN